MFALGIVVGWLLRRLHVACAWGVEAAAAPLGSSARGLGATIGGAPPIGIFFRVECCPGTLF